MSISSWGLPDPKETCQQGPVRILASQVRNPNLAFSSPPHAVNESGIEGHRSVEEYFDLWDGNEVLSFETSTDVGGQETQFFEVGLSPTSREGMQQQGEDQMGTVEGAE